MNLTRRGLITGLVAFAAAPAIVRAENLMPVRAEIIRSFFGIDLATNEGTAAIILREKTYLSMQMITRETVRLFTNSNAFIQSINRDFEREFGYNDGINWHPPRPKNQLTFAEWAKSTNSYE